MAPHLIRVIIDPVTIQGTIQKRYMRIFAFAVVSIKNVIDRCTQRLKILIREKWYHKFLVGITSALRIFCAKRERSGLLANIRNNRGDREGVLFRNSPNGYVRDKDGSIVSFREFPYGIAKKRLVVAARNQP